MNIQQKKEILADILEVDVEEIIEEKALRDYENWDSVAVLSVIAFMNEEFNRFPHASEILKYEKVADLLASLEE